MYLSGEKHSLVQMIAFKMHVLLKQYFPFQNILYNVFFPVLAKLIFL